MNRIEVNILIGCVLASFLLAGCGDKALITGTLDTGCGEVEAILFDDLTDHWGGSPIGKGGAYYTGVYPMVPRYLEWLMEPGDSLTVENFEFEIEMDTSGYVMDYKYYERVSENRWGVGFRYHEEGTWEYDNQTGLINFNSSGDSPVIEGTPISFSQIFLEKQPVLTCCAEMSWNNSSDGDDWLILKNIRGIELLREVRLKRYSIDF